MSDLPRSMISILALFAPLFSKPVFKNGALLLSGHFLSTSRRTLTNLLRRLGLHDENKFTKYFYVIRKAKWSSFKASKILLLLIVNRLVPKNAPIEINIDTNLNRRRGPKIKGLGRHRDAAASSKSQKVLSIGHNWLVVTIRLQIFGSKYKWSLPFLSYLLTSEQPLSSSKNIAELTSKSRHKKMTKVTCQIIAQIRRWVGSERQIIVVADSAFACREICKASIKYKVIFCTQLRLDASLHDFPPITKGKQRGRPRVAGVRLPSLNEILKDKKQKWERISAPWYSGQTKILDVLTGACLWYHNSVGGVPIRWVLTRDPEGKKKPLAILVTDLGLSKEAIIEFFVGRWSIETTFQEIHHHLGLEGIHTWSDLSVNRTAPTIIASYSLACLIVHQAVKDTGIEIIPEKTSWYNKKRVTFSDVMAYLRLLILNEKNFPQSSKKGKCGKIYIQELCRVMACA
jgi:hypothetical protein